ncbi:MAG: hypothetical protein HQM09_04585 [Candidatus Riflebacteria bacterium]|nr:hypothetical protein [Candidatus Riflebacteria bacterium]
MTCRKFTDWLELHGEDSYGPEWESLIVHVRGCPDCLLSQRARTLLRETMLAMQQPETPAGIIAIIRQNLDLADTTEEDTPPSVLERFFQSTLRPLEFCLIAACLFLIFGLSLPHASQIHDASTRHVLSTFPMVSAVHAPSTVSGDKHPGERLVRLTPEEISAFRRKLADYSAQHPEMNPGQISHSEGALVKWNGSR